MLFKAQTKVKYSISKPENTNRTFSVRCQNGLEDDKKAFNSFGNMVWFK